MAPDRELEKGFFMSLRGWMNSWSCKMREMWCIYQGGPRTHVPILREVRGTAILLKVV